MIDAPSVEEGLRLRMRDAEAPPAPKPLRVALPSGLRHVMVRDLPDNITLAAGRLEIVAGSAVEMLESLAVLAQAMQNDLHHVQVILEPAAPPKPRVEDEELRAFSLDGGSAKAGKHWWSPVDWLSGDAEKRCH